MNTTLNYKSQDFIFKWHLDWPEEKKLVSGDRASGLEVRGWVLTKGHLPVRLAIRCGRSISFYDLNEKRPDVIRKVLRSSSENHPQVVCGFKHLIDLSSSIYLGFECERDSLSLIQWVTPSELNEAKKFDVRGHDRDRNSEFGRIAYQLCRGKGIEIGALHQGFDLDACVIYVDRFSTSELQELYKNDPRGKEIKPVHIVCAENKYSFFDDNAFDFVISSHVLEHTPNPGRSIEEWMRIVKPGGIVYFVIPDKRYTFDKNRKLTSVALLLEKYERNVATTDYETYYDAMVNDSSHSSAVSENQVRAAFEKQASIHVHTFTAESTHEFLMALASKIDFEIVARTSQQMHIHFALKKKAPPLLEPQNAEVNNDKLHNLTANNKEIKQLQLNPELDVFDDRAKELAMYWGIREDEVKKIYEEFNVKKTKKLPEFVTENLETIIDSYLDKQRIRANLSRMMLRYHRYTTALKVVKCVNSLVLPNMRSKMKVLDYGCGVADYALVFAKNGYYPVICDLSGGKIEFAEFRFKIRKIEVNSYPVTKEVEYPKIDSKSIDVIVTSELLEHLRSPLQCLKNMHSFLKDGGYLWFSDFPMKPKTVGGDHLQSAADERFQCIDFIRSHFTLVDNPFVENFYQKK